MMEKDNERPVEKEMQSPTMPSSNPPMDHASPMSSTTEKPSHLHYGDEHHDIMPLQHPENPHNWPTLKKVYASAVGFAFAFVVAFGATAYTAGIKGIMKQFDVSMEKAVSGLSLYVFGIVFAPIYTPHLSEAFGRQTVYFACMPIFALFTLGAGLSKSFASLAVCRFFAGLTGGPTLVLIEGTFADVWDANTTGTYYAILTLASYVGTGCGPLIGGFVVAAKSWRWAHYVTLMLALAAYLLGIGGPETYGRSVMVRRAKEQRLPTPVLRKAASGVTISEMLTVTLFTPLKMLVTEPIVLGITIYLLFNFAVLFQWFITVPVVLTTTYNFTLQQDGLAFIAAIGGAILAALTSIAIDRLTTPKLLGRTSRDMVDVEHRLYPAMIGGIFITTSLFWIGWTAKPTVSWASPVLGTGMYVWGSAMEIISGVSYLFDAYPPKGTLSGLTAAASVRLLFAGALPLVIVQMFTNLTGAHALTIFGAISILLIPFPFLLFKFGPGLRARSRHSQSGPMGMDKHAEDV